MSPEGAIVILYGDSGSHKTNVALTLALDAIFDRGARVCYAAGEGAYGVRKLRVPAHCRARGITTQHLTGRFRVSPAVPLLAQPAEVEAFIKAQRDLLPDIVVLDTLATATAGEDENAAITAAMLTANGPFGKIRQELAALVLVLAHSGKDANRGVRGHSGFKGNADAVLRVTADKDAGTIEVFVEKTRDGRDRFSTYFLIETPMPGIFAGVPVPRRITASEYRTLSGT
jgi:putative DNA primase/helicase